MVPLLALAFIVSPQSCQNISDDKIHARDLAQAAPVFAQLPPDLVVGFAPAPGLKKTFRAGELQRILRSAGIKSDTTAEVCFAWKMRELNDTAVIAAMRAALQPRKVDVSIVESSRYPVPDGPLMFTDPPLTSANADAPLLWRGFIEYAPGRKYAVWARVLLRTSSTRIVATAPLRAGQPIRADELRAEPWSGPLTRLDELTSLEDAVGNTVKMPLTAGTVLRRSMLARPAEVLRGDTVQVHIVSANALISTEAVAEENGVRGAMIRVRNAATGKKYRALVDGRDAVSVNRNQTAVTGG